MKKSNDIHTESLPYVWEDILSEDTFLRNAALLTLKQTGRQSEDTAKLIMQKISEFKESNDPVKQEVYNSLDFEFGYFFED